MKYSIPVYLLLALILFNVAFLLQAQGSFLIDLMHTSQTILMIGNFLLIGLALYATKRSTSEHFSKHEASVFQLLYFILMIATAVILLLFLLSDPILFIIFMPFEFFLIAFYVGFYFLLTRHILPLKTNRHRL